VRFRPRPLDRVDVPPAGPLRRPRLRLAAAVAALAVAFLVLGGLGNVHAHVLHTRIFAWVGAVGFLVTGAVAVRRTADEFHRVIAARTGPSHAAIIRLLITIAGFAVVILAALGLLAVPVQHLLLGGALTGIIIGIAAQQALGNVFAGLVLLLARPFNVGDDIRIRSGSLGGLIEATVTGMGMTYVTVDTQDGPLSIPNSLLLAAGIGLRVADTDRPGAT
jgi:small-conductance mechanosensitive channel